ncbi:MAG: hypothetical protein QN127_08255 [Armatimonadota bacterium]|nr:hypothetical protein [Armatimonadota bacterium]MDR7588435.1 hypothetical protein [Armatimonadota bacterium]
MATGSDDLRRILEQEVAVHRELVRLARQRHLLLRRGKYAEAADLAVAEAACIVAVRDLERQRSRLAGVGTGGPGASRLRREMGALVRLLAEVERAGQGAWLSHLVPSPDRAARSARLN